MSQISTVYLRNDSINERCGNMNSNNINMRNGIITAGVGLNESMRSATPNTPQQQSIRSIVQPILIKPSLQIRAMLSTNGLVVSSLPSSPSINSSQTYFSFSDNSQQQLNGNVSPSILINRNDLKNLLNNNSNNNNSNNAINGPLLSSSLSSSTASLDQQPLFNHNNNNNSNNNPTVAAPGSATTSNKQSNDFIKQQNILKSIANNNSNNKPTNEEIINKQNNEIKKIFKKLGNYIFFDAQSPNDAFSLAFNTETNRFYHWKKFETKDYMKKLEAYFLLEGCSDRIYRFIELIHDDDDDADDGGNDGQIKSTIFLSATNNNNNNSSNSNNKWVYLIFEQHYGDLHSYMKEKKRLSEPEAKIIFKQCVEAIDDCHQNGIIVRDIKLKKFVFLDQEKTKVALTNLEDCLVLDEDSPNDLIKSQQGCPAYVSPEVLNPLQASYSGRLSDSWSLGIVLYTLLLGRYPFHHQTITTMFARIARGKFQIPPSTGLSMDAKILLRSLIRLKPDERLLPSEVLAHNWIKQIDSNQQLQYQQQQHQQHLLNNNHYNNNSNNNNNNETKYSNINSVSMAVNYLNNLNANSNILITNNVFNHKSLGISLSAPPNRSATPSTSSSSSTTATTSTSTALNSINNSNLKLNNNSDRSVPEFEPMNVDRLDNNSNKSTTKITSTN